jgi:hypothetical protein
MVEFSISKQHQMWRMHRRKGHFRMWRMWNITLSKMQQYHSCHGQIQNSSRWSDRLDQKIHKMFKTRQRRGLLVWKWRDPSVYLLCSGNKSKNELKVSKCWRERTLKFECSYSSKVTKNTSVFHWKRKLNELSKKRRPSLQPFKNRKVKFVRLLWHWQRTLNKLKRPIKMLSMTSQCHFDKSERR